MKELTIFSTYHNEYGICTQEDWDNATSGRCPAGTVRVQFKDFTQDVSMTYLRETTGIDLFQWEYQELMWSIS